MTRTSAGRAPAQTGISVDRSDSGRHCPACRHPAQSPPLEHSYQSALYACSVCDLHFWYPAKMPDASWYEATYQGRDTSAMPLEPGHLFFLADPQSPKKGRLLDMGCGTGNFLAAARDAGFAVTGFEPDQNAIRFARDHFGLSNVFAALPHDFQTAHPSDKFDAVTFFEVLEHQEDPQAFLDVARSFLNDDGFIALSVPNRDRWQIGTDPVDYPPNHLTRWSPQALRNFLERNGFTILSMREQPLTIPRAAQMLSAMFQTGMIARLAGEKPPALADLADMPHDKLLQTMDRLADDPRHGLARRLSALKSHAMFPIAALLLPYFRFRGRTGLYLYCLARPTQTPSAQDQRPAGGY